MLYAIANGVFSGAVYGLVKYYNKKQNAKADDREFKFEFKWGKFIKTLLIGGMVGGVATYMGLTIEVAFGNEMLYFAAVVAVEEAIKPVKRFLKRKGYLK